jgi:hypothetical protein
MSVVALAAWILPTGDRARWKNESYNELEELKQEGAPLLGDAIRIASGHLGWPWCCGPVHGGVHQQHGGCHA